MSEYTKIETARSIICDFCNQLYSDEPCEPADCDWIRMLEEDDADVVPVVRCKDCKHRYEDSWCEYVDDDDNFYCARGKRKEGADNG